MHVIRVLVVDGSRTARTATAETLATDPGVEVVGTADTGPMAFAKTATLKPDVVTLDSEVNDGDLVRTVKALRSTHPSVVVVLVASPTDAGTRTTVEALDAGIADYVTGPAEPRTAIAVQKMVLANLLPRVKALTGLAPPIPRRRRPELPPASRRRAAPAGRPWPDPPVAAPAPGARADRISPELAEMLTASGVELTPASPRALKPPRTRPPTVVLIGASTGGPEALAEVVRGLDRHVRAPVLVVQHMPAGFTQLLAERLDRLTHLTVREAVDGARADPGHLLVAPGGRHMELHRAGSGLAVRLTDAPPEQFVRPAVDVLFRTGAHACRDGVLAVVLTGMGRDGEAGARAVQEVGGTVIAQDEATSVVWGMPGCVARADLADAVLPLPLIGSEVSARLARRV